MGANKTITIKERNNNNNNSNNSLFNKAALLVEIKLIINSSKLIINIH